jgi:putative Mn2+ efflux pump MntP
MNHFQIILLALGLGLASFNDCMADGFALKTEGSVKQVRYFLFLLVTTVFFVALGLFIGISLGNFAGKMAAPFACAMLIVIGLKIMVEELLLPGGRRFNDASDIQTLIKLSLSDSVTPFVVSVAIGLLRKDFIAPFIICLTVIGIFAAIGILTGRTRKDIQTGLNLAPAGGLILLAAGLKLIITLLGS